MTNKIQIKNCILVKQNNCMNIINNQNTKKNYTTISTSLNKDVRKTPQGHSFLISLHSTELYFISKGTLISVKYN